MAMKKRKLFFWLLVATVAFPQKAYAVLPPITCDGETGINTAIGCIPFDSQGMTNWFFNHFIGIAGGIALLFMFWGAFQIITSGGDPEKVKNGKSFFVSAVSGLLFMLFSLFILRYVGVELLSIPGLQ